MNEIKEIDAYLHGDLGISDRLLFEARMVLNRELRIDGLTDDAGSDTTEIHTVDQKRLYTVVLSAGKKCLDMLTMFYHQRRTLSHIAIAVGLGSEHSAAVQKYKCLEKIRKTIKENSLHHEDFFE